MTPISRYQTLLTAASASDTAPPAFPTGTNNGETVGLRLSNLRNLRMTLAAPAGQTITSSGATLLGWIFSAHLGRWLRASYLDVIIAATPTTGEMFADREVFVDDASQVYWTRSATFTMAGTATNPAEQDSLILIVEGIPR